MTDLATVFCPSLECPARGQAGQGNSSIHSQKDKRFICTPCQKSFTETKGPMFYRLRTSAETVTLVVTLMAHGCHLQASVIAFGFDERSMARWATRAGIHTQTVQEPLVEQPRDLGQVQAYEIRVKTHQSIVWMALVMMVRTRLWLAGAVSPSRDMTLIRQLIMRVRRCAARRPLLVCTDGFAAYIRSIRDRFRYPVRMGRRGSGPGATWVWPRWSNATCNGV